MTEGIIQKVLGKTDYNLIVHIRDHFEKAYADLIIHYVEQSETRRKKELIAAIKRSLKKHNTCSCFRIYLIGDNE